MRAVAPQPAPIPRPLLALLRQAGALYVARPLQYFGVAAVALMGSWTVDLMLKAQGFGDLPLGALDDPRAPALFARIGRIFVAGIANGMVYALLGFAAQGIVALDVRERLDGTGPSLPRALRRAAPRLPALAGATLLFFGAVALLVAGGSLLAGVAGALGLTGGVFPGFLAGAGMLSLSAVVTFALALRGAFVPQVVALEGAGPLESLRRSLQLTRSRRPLWSSRLSELYLVRAALLMLALLGLQLAAGALGAVAKLAGGWLLGDPSSGDLVSVINPTGMPLPLLIPLEILSILLSAAVLPIGLVSVTLFYFDVRAGRDGALRSAPEPPRAAVPSA